MKSKVLYPLAGVLLVSLALWIRYGSGVLSVRRTSQTISGSATDSQRMTIGELEAATPKIEVTRVRSGAITVRSSESLEPLVADVRRLCESAYEYVERVFGTPPAADVIFYLLPGKGSVYLEGPVLPGHVVSFPVPVPHPLAGIDVNQNVELAYNVYLILPHELAHTVLSDRLPRWVSDGACDYVAYRFIQEQSPSFKYSFLSSRAPELSFARVGSKLQGKWPAESDSEIGTYYGASFYVLDRASRLNWEKVIAKLRNARGQESECAKELLTLAGIGVDGEIPEDELCADVLWRLEEKTAGPKIERYLKKTLDGLGQMGLCKQALNVLSKRVAPERGKGEVTYSKEKPDAVAPGG